MAIKNKGQQDGVGDQPPPSNHPGWPPPPPLVMLLLYTATGASAISLFAFYLRYPMVAVIGAFVATLTGAINIFMLSRR